MTGTTDGGQLPACYDNQRSVADRARAVARSLLRGVNRVLGKAGFSLLRATNLLDSRVTSEAQLRRTFRAIAGEPGAWLSRQNIFPVRETFDPEEAVKVFYNAYLQSPFRNAANGSGFNNLLSLYLIARAYRPELIIDSGTWKGASAWALALGAPGAKVLSFDIDLSFLEHRTPGVTFIEQDWTTYSFAGEDVANSLAYVDDHVDQARRLFELQERRIPVAIFDDDFSVHNFALHGHGGFSLPKIDFVLDDELRNETEISWIEYGRAHTWKVDREYLDRARKVIGAAERLPRFLEITGYAQLPYRIVRINLS